MSKYIIIFFLAYCLVLTGLAVGLVKDGKPVAEIVVPEKPTPSGTNFKDMKSMGNLVVRR